MATELLNCTSCCTHKTSDTPAQVILTPVSSLQDWDQLFAVSYVDLVSVTVCLNAAPTAYNTTDPLASWWSVTEGGLAGTGGQLSLIHLCIESLLNKETTLNLYRYTS